MNHVCEIIKNTDVVTIQFVSNRWLWAYTENLNKENERTTAHEIKYCPYCGVELEVQNESE